MSKIRTLDQLSSTLDHQLAWRKKELADLKSLVDLAPSNTRRRSVLLRSAITILYAHWEGFVKSSASAYLEFVSLKKLNYNQLSSNFIALAFKDKLKLIEETQKPTLYIECLDFIRSELDNRSQIPYKDVIKTNSNLSSSILKEIIILLGFDYSFYESKAELIDTRLLKNRNTVAHGEYLELELEDYIELHHQIIDMMNYFRNQIENSACQEKYKLS